MTTLTELRCEHCGYRWLPRTALPKACPQCSSRAWAGKRERERDERGRFVVREER